MTIVDRRYSVTEGTAFKAPVRAATTANITLSGEQTIDGVACVANDRVLVKSQTTGANNGIYAVSTGPWTRTRDFDGAFDVVKGTRVYVTDGTISAAIEYVVSSSTPVIGTDSITFASRGGLGGAFPDGTTGSPGAYFTLDNDTGIRRSASGTMRFVSNGTDIVEISPTGLTDLVGTSASPFNVASITALKALDTTQKQAAFLTQAGRSGLFIWTLGNYSTHIAADTLNGIYVKANAIAATTGAWVRSFEGEYYSRWFGAVDDSSTSNTSVINSAMAAISIASPGVAAYLNIERGVKFASTGLTFTADATQTHIYLTFLGDSDTTPGIHEGNQGTSELHTLSVNSGYPGNVNGGMVGELSFDAPLNPAYILNVAKNLTGADAYFGSGQVRLPTSTNAARATFGIRDENAGRFFIVYQNLAALTGLSGTSIGTTGRTISISGSAGFSGAAWTTPPTIGSVITGLTSGAKMVLYRAPAADVLDGYWITGTFVGGEGVASDTGTCTATIGGSPIVPVENTNASIFFASNSSNIGVDVDPINMPGVWSVGGRSVITKSQGLNGNPLETVTKPALVFAEGPADTTAGLQIVYNTTPSKLARTLGLVRGTAQALTPIGHVGAIAAHATFGNGATASTGSFGVSSIVRNGTGDYTITTSATAQSNDWTVSLTPSDSTDKAVVSALTTSTIRVQNYNHATLAAKDLAGNLHFMASGNL